MFDTSWYPKQLAVDRKGAIVAGGDNAATRVYVDKLYFIVVLMKALLCRFSISS